MSEDRLSAPEVVNGLTDIGGVLESRQPLTARLDYLVMQTARLLECDRCSLLLWDGQCFRVTNNWGTPPDVTRRFSNYVASLETPLVRDAFERRAVIVVNDPADYPGLRSVFEGARIDATVLAPMIDTDGHPVGFLTADYCERSVTFTELEGEIVAGIAFLAGVAIRADRDRTMRRRSEEARRRLRQELVEAEERERKRISHDIHDDVLQRVTAVAHHLEIASDQCDDEALCGRLRWLHREALSTAITLRTLVGDLLPTDVADRTLESALAGVVDSARAFHDIDIEVQVGRNAGVGEEVRSAIVKIARQAIDNAATHANASRVEVIVEVGDSGTILTVSDDGRGFDADDVSVRGIGTYSMHERAELLDGTCSITSDIGSGTTVEAVIPHLRTHAVTIEGVMAGRHPEL